MRVRVGATAIVALIAGGHVGAHADGTSVPNDGAGAKDSEGAAKPAAPLFQTVATKKLRAQRSEFLVQARVRTEERVVQSEPGQRLVVTW